jgi:hypothetical protein
MRDGRMLLSCRGGIFAFDKGRPVPTLKTEPAYSILRARDGTLWVGTRSELLHADNGTVKTFGKLNDDYGALYEDADGVMWAGNDHAGLIRVKREQETLFASLGGPFSDSILQIFEDTVGNSGLALCMVSTG